MAIVRFPGSWSGSLGSWSWAGDSLSWARSWIKSQSWSKVGLWRDSLPRSESWFRSFAVSW